MTLNKRWSPKIIHPFSSAYPIQDPYIHLKQNLKIWPLLFITVPCLVSLSLSQHAANHFIRALIALNSCLKRGQQKYLIQMLKSRHRNSPVMAQVQPLIRKSRQHNCIKCSKKVYFLMNAGMKVQLLHSLFPPLYLIDAISSCGACSWPKFSTNFPNIYLLFFANEKNTICLVTPATPE